MKSFSESSYRAQVLRLRQMAEAVLKHYQIDSYQLKFIHHGENATFKVVTKTKVYLLRLHRHGYHSQAAIIEEMKWLSLLSKNPLLHVQKPVRSKQNKLVVQQKMAFMPSRYCSLLEWQNGKGLYHGMCAKDYFLLGEMTAYLHASAKSIKVKNRKYWSAQGLLGGDATFGSIDLLSEVLNKSDFSVLKRCRELLYKKVNSYEKNNPGKISMIHSDLHFGNLVWQKDKIIPIDFDDCGLGFHAYDIAVSLLASTSIFKRMEEKKAQTAKESYLDGYLRAGNLSKEDLEMISYFALVRHLVMVVWRYERRDNPRIFNYFKKQIQFDIKVFRESLNYGPAEIL